jgi:hypothetical protein
MQPEEFAQLLRTELPRLLREHPEVRHEIWGIFLEAFPARQEFTTLLEEIRAFREDADRRFEAMDRRFEAVDRRFEAIIDEMRQTREQAERRSRELELHLSALGLRVGRGLEHVIREIVEEFSGQTFTTADRLVLIDTEGVVFGVRGAQIEFDLYAADGTAYLVEVKSHVKPGDVLTFHRKTQFAAQTLQRPFTPLIIALSMEAQAERLMQTLGIQYRVRTRVE